MIKLSPNNTDTNVPSMRKGPKGILPITVCFLDISAGTIKAKPETDAINKVRKTNIGLVN